MIWAIWAASFLGTDLSWQGAVDAAILPQMTNSADSVCQIFKLFGRNSFSCFCHQSFCQRRERPMPVHVDADVRRLDQEEFRRIAYDVMEQVFAVHNEMGRFFDEGIYRNAVASKVARSRTEVLIEVHFDDFRKQYSIDLLVDGGAVFELKAVRMLGAPQRAQLLNYLLLTGLSHGKLVNFRQELVEHEFVNTHLELADRTEFRTIVRGWKDPGPNGRPLQPWLLALLRDVGTGLDVRLYENAVSHVFGGDDAVLQDVAIFAGTGIIGSQKLRIAAPGWAFKVTAIDGSSFPWFEDHARRLLGHTTLDGLHWINVTRECVAFTTIEK
jgi:GxxExxY protein